MDDGFCESFLPKERLMANGNTTPKELHVCAGLNACAGHGKSGNNACAGTGDCATVVNDSCHGNNDCRGQGGCGGGGSLGSQQTVPGENLCRGKGSCRVPSPQGGQAGGIDASRTMGASGEQAEARHKGSADPNTAIPGIYEGRHVWQVARLLFEQRMMAQGRTFTTDPSYLGPQPPKGQPPIDKFSAANNEFPYFGPPPADKPLGPNSIQNGKLVVQPDRPSYQSS
jgi:hypothetical protein